MHEPEDPQRTNSSLKSEFGSGRSHSALSTLFSRSQSRQIHPMLAMAASSSSTPISDTDESSVAKQFPRSRLMMRHMMGRNTIRVAFICQGTGNVAWIDAVGWMAEDAMFPGQPRAFGPGGLRPPSQARIMVVCGNENDAIGIPYLRHAQSVMRSPNTLMVHVHSYLNNNSWASEDPNNRSAGPVIAPEVLRRFLLRSTDAPEPAAGASSIKKLRDRMSGMFGSFGAILSGDE